MATKLSIQQKVYNLGQKEFRFTLSEPSEGTLVLHHIPDNWLKSETTYARHEKYHSVLRNVSSSELTFYKEGRNFLKNVYENSGIDANATMLVERLDKTTYDYETYPSAGKFDFSTYQVDETAVNIQMVDTEFKEKIINRSTTQVDINKLVTIDGYEVAPFAIQDFNMPETVIDNEDSAVIGGTAQTVSPVIVPISSVTNVDFTEMQVPTNSGDTKASAFFKEATHAKILDLVIAIDVTRTGTGDINYTLIQIDDSENVLFEYGIDLNITSDTIYNFTKNQQVTLSENDSLILKCTFACTSVRSLGTLDVSEYYKGNQATTLKGFGYYEAFLRTCQLIF